MNLLKRTGISTDKFLELHNNISVIIPVFNAGKFVKKAVESALILPEVKEVLLIEDGSSDNSLEICKELEIENDKISLFTHSNNQNKGAGLSRNIGIENAKGDFIAFLDADDYYLPNRFEAEKNIFEAQSDVDGVYGALGFHYYSNEGKQKFDDASFGKLTTLNGRPEPDQLFLSLTWLHPKINGHFSVVALTLKRKIFEDKAEKFNALKMHEDTVFIVQLSLTCKLVAGMIDKPVALRGVHDNNRIVNNKDLQSRLIMWQELYQWAKTSKKKKSIIQIFQAFVVTQKIRLSNRIYGFFLFTNYSLSNSFFFKKSDFFNPSCARIFEKRLAGFIIKMKDILLWRTAKVFKLKETYDF
jgi:glycosyltransferase involved in cell wall biosynthesis